MHFSCFTGHYPYPPFCERGAATVNPTGTQTVQSEHAAQLSAANDVLQRSLERLAHLSDVRLLVSEVLTSIIEVAGAAGGAVLRYEPSAHTLVLQSYVLDGIVLDAFNSERLARQQETMPADSFPNWNDILGATDRFFAYDECGVRPLLGDLGAPYARMNSAGLALRRGEAIIGLLILVYHTTDPVPAERLVATRTLTRYAALVLEMTWLADESRRTAVIRAQAQAAEERASELARANAVLSRSIEMLTSYEDLPSFTGEILQEAIRASGADNGAVALFDEATDTMRRVAACVNGTVIDLATDGGTALAQPFVLWPAAWRLLRETRMGFWIDWENPGAGPPALRDASSEVCDFTQRTGDRFAALLPLVLNGETIGFLGLAFQSFSEQRWPLVREICGLYIRQLTLALHSARIAESVKTAAIAEERNRLARDIHDTLAQALALIVMQLQRAESKLGPAWESARAPLETVRQLATEGLAQARRSVGMLRPPVTPHGLIQAVQESATLVRLYFHGPLEVSVTGTPHALDRSVEEELFAIVREALTNAAKHSQATRINVDLAYLDPRSVRVAVTDDGTGFDPEQAPDGRYGLVGMYERASRIGAVLTLATEPGAGTEIVAVWPNV
jgi:signal transduction histidine kinase